MGKNAKVLRVLVVTRKPHSASFEQRIHNYIEPLRTHGIEVEVQVYPKSISAQFKLLATSKRYDMVWWHRHLLPRLQLWWLRRHAKHLVYDFDDPLCFSTREDGHSFIRRKRFTALLSACDSAMVGSGYLRDLALAHCSNVHLIPMSISLPVMPSPQPRQGGIELLWLGSKSTQKYLEGIRPALERIGEIRPDIKLRLVAHKPMEFGRLQVEFVQWNPESQEKALLETDIGLCPMPDTPWTRGKCPYKVLQYMAYGMPWVGSAVGENLTSAGVPGASTQRGFCARTMEEWVDGIIELADCPEPERLGLAARNYIESTHERTQIAAKIASVLKRFRD